MEETRGQDSAPGDRSRRSELRGALLVFSCVTLSCSLLFQLERVAGFLPLHELIAAIFLYVPTLLVSRRSEDHADYGLTHRPLVVGLLYFAGCSAVVFPAFAAGAVYYYRGICRMVRERAPLPGVYRRMCRRFVGGFSRARLRGPDRLWRVVMAQLIVVALPEEYFFRGYLQTRLTRAFPPRRRLLGAPTGVAIALTSVLFALGHVLVDFNGLRFAVFFPSLLFGWLRAATGSILAGVLFHASCNLVSDVVHQTLFGR